MLYPGTFNPVRSMQCNIQELLTQSVLYVLRRRQRVFPLPIPCSIIALYY